MKYNNILEDSGVRLSWWCVSDTVLGRKYAEVSVTHPIKRSHADLSEEKRAASWLCRLPHQHHCHVLVMLLLAWQNESKAKDTTVAQVLLLVSRSCQGCPLCTTDMGARCFAAKGGRRLCLSGPTEKTGVKGTTGVFCRTPESKIYYQPFLHPLCMVFKKYWSLMSGAQASHT